MEALHSQGVKILFVLFGSVILFMLLSKDIILPNRIRICQVVTRIIWSEILM